ncbi:acyltransferase [Marinobacter psychrophilus]|jgi:virginiamycin A acetyltransferase|uniref:acyltransferase n=1 Tax=Marinobacter psychrophilus TaxID=330734 RepID=UPI001B5B7CCE|nr:acyltransferase [Marinobacter psychrophilus]MBQ0762758.1 acyltransferase [Marinobacter psychrophilus]MBQ0844480.1 acyltransferase [Marinobacter psychrophilus]
MTARQITKRSIKNVFLVLMWPVYALYRALSMVGDIDGTFMSFSQALSLMPGKLGIYMRAAFYRLVCTDTSDEISVGFLTILSHRNTSIAKGVYIGPQCNIGMCSIGENTLIGSGVHILSGSRQHEFQDVQKPIQDQGGAFEKIRIGADCWVGNSAVIMATVADGCIVAAGSVLSKSANKEGDILAGNPSRTIRNRFVDSSQTQQGTVG